MTFSVIDSYTYMFFSSFFKCRCVKIFSHLAQQNFLEFSKFFMVFTKWQKFENTLQNLSFKKKATDIHFQLHWYLKFYVSPNKLNTERDRFSGMNIQCFIASGKTRKLSMVQLELDPFANITTASSSLV